MPAILLTLVLWIAAHVVAKIVTMFGLAVVAYVGFDLAMGALETWIIDRFDGLPVHMVQLMGILQIDTAIKMILVAFLVRWLFMSMNGALARFATNATGGLFVP